MLKSRKLILTTILIVVVGMVSVSVYMFMTSDPINDAYALLGASEMLISYMESHQGAWPRTWDELLPQFKQNNGRVAGWSFERFQSRVAVDFDSDPEKLRQASLSSPVATFEVIRPKHLLAAQMGSGPNQVLCDYFRQKPAPPRPKR